MSLVNLIRKRKTDKPANDNSAKAANDGQVRGEQLAGLARLALAKSRNAEVVSLPDSAMEARRQRVLDMLAERPGTKYAVVVDDPDADPVILSLAIRGATQGESTVTCELQIAREKYDPFLLLDLIGRHGGTTH